MPGGTIGGATALDRGFGPGGGGPPTDAGLMVGAAYGFGVAGAVWGVVNVLDDSAGRAWDFS